MRANPATAARISAAAKLPNELGSGRVDDGVSGTALVEVEWKVSTVGVGALTAADGVGAAGLAFSKIEFQCAPSNSPLPWVVS